MQRSNVCYLAGAAVLAAAFTAALTPAVRFPATMMLTLTGASLFAAGAYYRGKENQRDIKREFKDKYAPAVRRFLGVLGTLYARYDDNIRGNHGKEEMLSLVSEAKFPDLASGPDTSHKATLRLYEFLGICYERKLFPRDRVDDYEDARMVMVGVYQRWVRRLNTRRVTSRFERWLSDTIGPNHTPVFKLWLYVELVHNKTSSTLSPPKLERYEPLVEQWR